MTTALTVVPTPTRHKPRISQAICDALASLVAKGNYNVTACQLIGITESTFYDWLKRGQQDIDSDTNTLYSYLFEAIKKAEAASEDEMVQRVRAAALPGVKGKKTKISPDGTTVEISESSGDWLAAATYLERRHPDRWGRRDRTRVDITETKSIQITHVEIVLTEAGPTPAIEA